MQAERLTEGGVGMFRENMKHGLARSPLSEHSPIVNGSVREFPSVPKQV